MLRWAGRISLVLIVAWIAFLAVVYAKMSGPTEQFGMFMSKLPMPFFFVLPFETLWSSARRGTVNVGDTAPDFELTSLDKSQQKVKLSEFRGSKPVVLIFGSYT